MTLRAPILSVAPMMRHSHRHARMLWHMLCPQALLYTEMAPAAAVMRNRGHAQRHPPAHGQTALQLAGTDLATLAAAARRGAQLGFTEINLNCGCPSARVTAGGFGACQMATPEAVARCVAAMCAACDVPVTVKCRIAIDNLDPESCLDEFAHRVHAAGATTLVVHARKAWLGGLNPKQNRTRPALDHPRVRRLKQAFPSLRVITNGGINSVVAATACRDGVDGVMLGRAIIARPALLAAFAHAWFGTPPVRLETIIARYLAYCAGQLAHGEHPRRLLAPLLGLAAGRPGGHGFRRTVTAATGSSGDLASIQQAWV